MHHDVVVLGGGPAGLAAAAACAQVGLRVARVDPAPGERWLNTYGAWVDELAGTGVEGAVGHRFDRVEVVGSRSHELARAYGVFDNEALATLLTERATGVEVLVGRAVGANHDRRRSTVVLRDGRFLDAALVIDATGADPVLVHRPERPARAEQVAYGVVARCRTPPYEPGTCMLMDWSGAAGRDPTFLYALDLGDGWWLLEETSLARRPPASLADLETRLHRRLAARGVVVSEVRAVEEVAIPLGLPQPDLRQRAVGFGAAASMVHPATGYSVAASLRVAPELATAVVQALERRATPEGVAAAAWSAVWPPARRKANRLFEYGLDALLRLDSAGTAAFFDAFFDLPADQWFGYLTGTASPAEVARTMREVFRAVPPGVRATLARGNPARLVRAAV